MKDFDVVLFGATGFTGQRCAAELDGRAGIRWAIAGRDRAKLEELRSSLGSAPEILVADSFDRPSLDAMTSRTRVVCTTVGPYATYGDPLVESCIANDTDTCDLTGEPQWVRHLVDDLHDAAVAAGVRVVNCCGVDSIPSDLGTFLVQETAIERHGRPCDEVRALVWRLRGGLSGGTVASGLEIAKAASEDPHAKRVFEDPYSLNPPGERQGPDQRPSSAVRFDEEVDGWVGPFLMEYMNAKIVRRSNALMSYRYGRDFRYSEQSRMGQGPVAAARAAAMAVGTRAWPIVSGIGPVRKVLEATVLPKPGEGPSDEAIERGVFEMRFFGTYDDATPSVAARFAGQGDPGYGITVTMLVESALCLALDRDALPDRAGVLTPASAMGKPLVERLRNAGLTLELCD